MTMIPTKDVALHCRTTESQIRSWVSSGAIPAPVVVDGVARWTQADLSTWEAAGCPRGPRPDDMALDKIMRAIYHEGFNTRAARARRLRDEAQKRGEKCLFVVVGRMPQDENEIE